MIFGETLLAVGLSTICLPNKRSFEILSNANSGSSSFYACSGNSVEKEIADQLRALPSVDGVDASRNGDLVSVQVQMAKFDRVTRRRVYQKEKELFDSFPAFKIDICLVDTTSTANAVTE